MNIDNKIRADLFRNRIEDKNQLTGAGAIYVGTGIPKYIDSTGATTGTPSTGTIGPFYETTSITPTTGGQVPVSVMGTGSAEATGTVAGLKFKSVNDAMKREDGSILLAASGISVRSSNGITFLNEDAADTDISIINRKRNISVNAAQNVSIEGQIETKISNVSLDTNLKGPTTGSLYIAPSGSASLSTDGVTGTYSSDKAEESLAPIIYNIGQRLDSLGFKEEVVKDGSGNDLLKFSKIGYYVFVNAQKTFEKNTSVQVPKDFQKKSTAKLLHVGSSNGDWENPRIFTCDVDYKKDNHSIEIVFDVVGNIGMDGYFLEHGTTFGYDIRE